MLPLLCAVTMAGIFSTTTPNLSRRAITNSIPKVSLAKSISSAKRPNSIVVSAVRNDTNYKSFTFELPNDGYNSLKKLLDSCFVVRTSVALSVCLFVTDVDSASAFVVTTPRKLQTDELATVLLFQENTPSVVYITNLASKQDAFTLDVLEVPQGSGLIWDAQGHVVTNYHVIRGACASDLKLILGDIITSINGKKVSNGTDLYRILDQCKVGDKITVEVLRGDHLEKIPVVLEPKPDES